MNKPHTQYDLVIIGGGAAGIMAAISAFRHNPGLNIALMDRTFALGRKILVCGAGRCNITNINLDKSIEEHYYGADSDFSQSIFSQFGYADIVNFFNELGIELYVERKTDIGKLFPTTNQAKTVTSLLEDELQRNNIQVVLNSEVVKLAKTTSGFTVEYREIDTQTKQPKAEVHQIGSEKIILAAGGKTYPALGSNGSGYKIAEDFGHKIITPVPSALPLEGKSPLSQELQGVRAEIEVTSFIGGKKIKTRTDEVMFTQYGLSGPAILNISREVSIHFNRENKADAYVSLNFFPGQDANSVHDMLEKRWAKRPTQQLEKSLYGILPNKVAAAVLKILEIDASREAKSFNAVEKKKLVGNLVDWRVEITGTRGWNEAEFTAGGVDTTEVKPATLESKLVKDLYFAGEIMDVDGDVGGFNLSWGWSSGYVAGQLK